MSEQLVSVIIPTYNSESTIEACLSSIKNQTYKNIEIIISDKFSTHPVIEIAEKYGAKVIEDDSIRSKARNIAVKEAKGEFIFSIDSDMELNETVIEECVRKSEEFESIIVPEISFGIGFWAKCKTFEKILYIGDEAIEAARFFKKKIFETVEGYDPLLEFAEDWDIHQRIKNAGFKVGRVESLIRHNEGKLKLWKTIKKKYQYGKTLEKYRIKHPKDFSKQSKLMRPAFIRNWKLFIKNPIVGIGTLFMKSCEFSATMAGFLVVDKKI